VQLHHLGITRGEAGQYQRLAGHLVYAAPVLRSPSETIESGSGGQPGLWGMGISGDLPIILVRISDIAQLSVSRDALQAVEYWRMKRLAVDLVIINELASSYRSGSPDRAGDFGEAPASPGPRLEKMGHPGTHLCCAPI